MVKAKTVVLVCLLSALLNILPLLFFHIGGDIFFHYVMIDCFAHQFWQGDLYPRWCMDANAGLGAPLFMFYFPLPYYVTALLWPLRHIGFTVYDIYTMGAGLATLVSFLTCYSWLKDIVTPRRALLAAVLFLFMPYRMEALYFRSAYAEIWGIAFLPLVFKYTRMLVISHHPVRSEAEAQDLSQIARDPALRLRLTQDDGLAISFALLFLSHLPCAMAAVIFSGIYMLVMSGKAWLPKIRYGISLLWGAAMAAFYLLPAAYYRRFITPDDMVKSLHVWANHYLNGSNFLAQPRPVALIGLTLLALALLLTNIIRNRDRMEDSFLRREACAWAVMLGAALFLLLPVSAPVYVLLGQLSRVVFPWRMQSVFILCLTFALALWMQWFVTPSRMKTWKADYGILLALMVMLSYFPLMMRDASFEATGKEIIDADQINMIEYRSVWTDAAHFTMDYTLSHYGHKAKIARVETVKGEGRALLLHWAWDGIVLQTQSVNDMTVRLDHTYFPLWAVMDEKRQPVALHPELATGRMLLDIPAGLHTITLSRDMNNAPFIVRWSWLASAVALLVMVVDCLRKRKSAHA